MPVTAPTLSSGRQPVRPETFGGDIAGLFNFFIDPVSAAGMLPNRFFWIAPLVFTSACTMAYLFVSGPIMQRFLETAPLPPNAAPDQYARAVHIQMTVFRFAAYATPLIAGITALIEAAVLLGLSSVAAIRARFLELFNLVAGCSVISGVQMLAWMAILQAKGEIASRADLKPPLGLDILLPASANKFLLGTLGYFSVFQIWWIVMMIAVYSVGFRTGKGKAAAVVLPLVLFGLMMALVGAAFQRT